jgi:hypothetical protein
MMRMDVPEVLGQVLEASDRYEAALAAGDVDTLNGLFWQNDRALRIGEAELQSGHEEISAYRRSAGSAAVVRSNISRRAIALGDDVAVVDVFSSYPDDSREGRQTQVWIRTAEGWRVAHAHVSRFATPIQDGSDA